MGHLLSGLLIVENLAYSASLKTWASGFKREDTRKSEAPNPKSETIPNDQNSNDQNNGWFRHWVGGFCFCHWGFDI
jgi:hypothetical protein